MALPRPFQDFLFLVVLRHFLFTQDGRRQISGNSLLDSHYFLYRDLSELASFCIFCIFSTGIFSKSEPNIFSDFLYFTLVLWKYPLTLASGCHHLIEGKSTQTLARKLCCLKGPPVWPRLFCWYSGFETYREQPVPASEKTSKYCRILFSFFLLH